MMSEKEKLDNGEIYNPNYDEELKMKSKMQRKFVLNIIEQIQEKKIRG